MQVFRARWLVPVDRPPIENGAMVIEHGRIVDVGPASTVKDPGEVCDLGDCIVLPGFVNAHTHLELTCYRGRLSPRPFWDWIEDLIALRREGDASRRERDSIATGAAESLACGVTCVGDISRQGIQVEALRASPIRKVCFLELISGASQPPSDPASLAALLDEISSRFESERLILGVSPHAPYTVSPDHLRETAALARRRQTAVTMHVAETREEIEWMESGGGRVAAFLSKYDLPTAKADPPGSVPRMLAASAILDASPLLVHLNYADDETLNAIARTGASVAWCPRAHAYFGHTDHRWPDMMDAGINVCVGTDSMASNTTLSILDELRDVRRRRPDVDPDVVLAMGTLRGAAALGLDSRIGSLTPGKLADFVCVPWTAGAPGDPIRNLLEADAKPAGTWIGGDRAA